MKHEPAIGKKALKLIFGILLVLLSSTCSVADREVNDNAEPTVPRFTVLLVRDYLPSALALAQEWQSDAYLLNISVDVELPHVKSISNEISFEFRSPSNENISLVIFCQKTCSSEELTTTIELPQCLPLEISDSLLESREALELGLKNGGVDYINGENAYAFMYLERNYPRCNGSTVTWRVQFGNYFSSEQVLFVFDAESGELLETR